MKGVKSGRNYVKWGNLKEYLLNWVKDVKKLILGGKKWNSLIPVHSNKSYYTYSISLHGSHYKGFCIRAALSLSLLILFSAT
jgi:hypothetical protein